jgi:phage-related protein
MALDMTAAGRIQATVDGTAQVDGLQRSLDKVDKQASGLQGTFGRLRNLAGGLGGALGALVPAAGIAGLTALAKGSIDAADNLNDLRQRTGVSVENLSKFGAAAEDAGSSIDEVAKSMGRLSKGIVDPASKTNEALKSIGINSRDAAGNVRGVDAIMLDLADKFAKMPDGAQKTALAMELFGRSGANLIPMLNGGREALSQYQATISGDMASAADQFNDSLNAIARTLAGPFNQAVTALLPTLTQVAQGLAAGIQWFSTLPQPIQNAALVIGALGAAFIALAPAISLGISLLGAIGPALAAIGPAVSTLLPILAAVFSGPVGWVALLVAAGAAVYVFRDQIGAAFQAVGKIISDVAAGFKAVFIDPVAAGLRALVEFINNTFVRPIQDSFTKLVEGVGRIFGAIKDAITAPFKAAFETVRGIVNQILRAIGQAVGSVVQSINSVISGANGALANLGLPQIPYLPMPQIPQFAEGGVVNGPTLAMVGEGGEPEYIVPQSKATRFANNWLAGMRGGAAIPQFADGGVVMPSTAQVSIQTGPVTQMNGTDFVTKADMSQAVQAGVQQTLSLIRNDINVRNRLRLA